MAKRKAKKPAESAIAVRDRKVDGMFQRMIDGATKVLGREDVSISAKCEELLCGLPLPALCLQYLLQMNILPLGRVIQLAGPEGSCKSSLLYEIMMWHMMYGGGAVLAENEDKDAAVLRHSIWWRNPVFMNRCAVAPTASVEQWQRFLTSQIIEAQRAMDEKDGIGRTIPMCFGIDSLTATDVEKVIEKTLKDGAAAPGYALIAKSIACYMRTFTGLLRGYPFTMVGTNHLKAGTDAQGLPTTNIPGGRAIPFMATIMLEMARDMNADIDKVNEAGLKVVIKAAKNSLGPSRKKIRAEFLWWREPGPDGNLIQRHVWDWHTASIDLLVSFALQDGKKGLFKEINQIVDLHPGTKEKRRMVWSRALGIPESQPEHFRVAGKLLQARTDLLAQLYPLLGINVYPVFQPGMDYLQTLQEQKATIDAKQVVLTNEDLSKLPVVNPTTLPADAALAEGFGDVTEPEPEFESESSDD